MKYKELLIDKMFPFVCELLERYGEFYPLAAAIKSDGSIATIAAYDGEDRPISIDIIKSLKQALRDGHQEAEYIAGVIFFDVLVIEPGTVDKRDAIAVLYESAEEQDAVIFYYPYAVSDQHRIIVTGGWCESEKKEIFINI